MVRALLVAVALLAGCETDPCDGRVDLTLSPAGLALTEAEHPAGWGQPTCAQCHPAFTLHDAACADVAGLDLAAIDAEADLEDPSTCVACHGPNGVAAWEEDAGAAR